MGTPHTWTTSGFYSNDPKGGIVDFTISCSESTGQHVGTFSGTFDFEVRESGGGGGGGEGGGGGGGSSVPDSGSTLASLVLALFGMTMLQQLRRGHVV